MDTKIAYRALNSNFIYLQRYLNRAEKLAAAVLIGVILFALVLVIPQSIQRDTLEVQRQGLAQQVAEKMKAPPVAEASPKSNDDLDDVPKLNQLPDVLGKIIQTAQTLKLTPEEANYHLVQNASSDLVAYQIVVPLTGSYANVMKFITQVLNALPYVALDRIGFQRDSIAENEVEAALTLTAYFKRDAN
jgi:hypothetical protein